MSTFGVNTRSSGLMGRNNNMNNVLANKASATNLNGKNVLAAKPMKRAALSQKTNLVNRNVNLNGKIGNLNNEKKAAKISSTENETVNEATNKLKGGFKSKIPIKNGLKPQVNNQQKNQLTNPTDELNKLNEENLIRFSSFKIPADVENIDLFDTRNVLLANDFSNDIYIYLNYLEEKLKLKTNFLEIQQQMTSKMRTRLIDWIVAVHYKYKLLPETLYLTIAIMDRFLEKVNVTKEKVQLVGLTAFFIACKYEEIYPPEISDFIKVCDAYSKNEILKMEKTILKALDFVLSYPLPLHFLRRFSQAAHADQEIHTLAKYLMELGLLEYECSSWKPSLLAATSLYLSLQILSNDETETKWTETLAFYTNLKETDLQPYVSTLCKILILTKDSKLQTVNKKYSSLKLLSISDSPKLECDYVIEMSEKCTI